MTTASLERRLDRLEAGSGGWCPECAPARDRFWASIFNPEDGEHVPNRCLRCGRDVRPTIEDVDRILSVVDEEEA